jgi:hypothetical protein
MVRLAASDTDEAVLVRNLTVAFKVSDWFAETHHLNMWDVRDVMVTMLVTESGGGFIYANDGQGYREPDSVANRTPWNWNPQTNKPIGTAEQRAQMRAVLRRSLELPHDKVGSNGRSTGPAQQLSVETGGAWGPMAATMRMDLSVLMFLDAVDWANRDVFYPSSTAPNRKRMDNWQTAMLLRVQRPLASEVATNYGAAQLARAQAITRDERFTPGSPIEKDWFMANNWDEAKAELDRSLEQLKQQVASLYNDNVLTNDDGTSAGLPYGKQAAGFNDVREVLNRLAPRASQVDGLTYSLGDFLVSIDRKLTELQNKVDALTTKVNG